MERVEVDEDNNAAMYFRFPPPAHSGKIVITVENAGKEYGPKRIFSGAEFIIAKGEKIGFVGRNGEGKSTMMKMIANKIQFEGEVKLGHGVLMGYFEQDQEEKLDTDKTVFQTIDDLAAGDIRKRVRNLLGAFLFSGDDIEKKVKVLSGGERGRLALCKLLLEPYNLLLLDEPTNHLDIRSKEILKQALLDYEGTIVMVSHDRDFMKGMCTRLFEFRDGHVKEHLGGIEEFMELRKVERLNELDLDKSGVKKEVVVEKKKPEVNPNEQEQKQLRNQLKKVEAEIERLEKEIKTCDSKLADPETQNQVVNDKAFLANYSNLKSLLEKEMQNWEELSSKLS
jgi:ATP-binding cassette subfamily F protein 3